MKIYKNILYVKNYVLKKRNLKRLSLLYKINPFLLHQKNYQRRTSKIKNRNTVINSSNSSFIKENKRTRHNWEEWELKYLRKLQEEISNLPDDKKEKKQEKKKLLTEYSNYIGGVELTKIKDWLKNQSKKKQRFN